MSRILNSIASKVQSRSRSFAENSSGAVALMAAFMIPVVILAAAMTIEYSLAARMKNKMQVSTDAALMAAAVEISKMDSMDNTAEVEKELISNFDVYLKANMENFDATDYEISNIEFDPVTKNVSVDLTYTLPNAFYEIAGISEQTRNVVSEIGLSEKTRDPVSMMLVLDKSGSMWGEKIEALKKAVLDLGSTMSENDPDDRYVRLGVTFYDTRKYYNEIAWGTDDAIMRVKNVKAGGGTASAGAMQSAYAALNGQKEDLRHSERNDGVPRKVIVFMTDGQNNAGWREDKKTLRSCDKAKNNAGAEIYSIAFQAPANAQALLKACASSDTHYFNANDAAGLLTAFKQIGETEAEALAFSK